MLVFIGAYSWSWTSFLSPAFNNVDGTTIDGYWLKIKNSAFSSCNASSSSITGKMKTQHGNKKCALCLSFS